MAAEPEDTLSLLYDVFVLSQRVRTLLGSAMSGAALRPDEYAVYSAVTTHEPISTSDLARSLGMPVTTVHDYVRAMLERGHLVRERDPRDGRAWLLSASPAGRRVHAQAGRLFDEAHQRLLDALPVGEAEARAVVRAMIAATTAASESLASASVDAAS